MSAKESQQIPMSIEKAYLFICSNSPQCKDLKAEFEDTDVLIVKLDSKEARTLAKSSKIKLDVVPMLVVFFQDGDVDAFKGRSKCIDWVSQYKSAINGEQSAGIEEIEQPQISKHTPTATKSSDLRAKAAELQRQRESLWGDQDKER
jgi:hypothetical protein